MNSSTQSLQPHDAATDMQPKVQIVGAGIAGLSLACHLRLRRIPFKIFDAAAKPKGHNYGITLSRSALDDLLPAVESSTSTEHFIKNVAVDRLVDGQGRVTASDPYPTSSATESRVRASDSSLRNILAHNHDVHWNHRVCSTDATRDGLKLTFENETTSTASITIDGGGERSGLQSVLLPDLKPDILPYAVYHGSRYVPISDFQDAYHDLFQDDANVRDWTLPYHPPYPNTNPTSIYLQISRAYILQSDLPSPVQKRLSITTDREKSKPIVELRYTLSRPALTSKIDHNTTSTSTSYGKGSDPLFKPNRTATEAKETPTELFTEIEALLDQSRQSKALPTSLTQTLLSRSEMEKNEDRILNWLLRSKIPSVEDTARLADRSVAILAVGDASCSLPILGSEGAVQAMRDAKLIADWLEECVTATAGRDGGGGVTFDFGSRMLAGRNEERREVEKKSRAWLERVHGQERSGGNDSRL